ncbi:thioredoxin family protein [Acidovorax sp. SUPP1855]|uniref:thioredoxin family protein n=1 Tax=Acidovorax sp. SUPP1855 TaxID=431774 RepID=UPI0023DE5510|nr:thioredoxin family protein [Acidovorax sp. SUPP1855]GKS85533.1 thioredoxin family protein [Acidovorax sp. SUPP1855]
MHAPAASPDTFFPSANAGWWVVCLCAGWCGACREYSAVFDTVAQAHPQARFVWVDIEDEEDLAGDLDVETFPTLLIADPAGARFLGPLLPQSGVLARLLDSLASQPPAARDPQAQALIERVRAARG